MVQSHHHHHHEHWTRLPTERALSRGLRVRSTHLHADTAGHQRVAPLHHRGAKAGGVHVCISHGTIGWIGSRQR